MEVIWPKPGKAMGVLPACVCGSAPETGGWENESRPSDLWALGLEPKMATGALAAYVPTYIHVGRLHIAHALLGAGTPVAG